MTTLPLYLPESTAVPRIEKPSLTEWVSVKDALPADGVWVHVYIPSKQPHHYPFDTVRLENFRWIDEVGTQILDEVTYWMGFEEAPDRPGVEPLWMPYPNTVIMETLKREREVWIWNEKAGVARDFWCSGGCLQYPYLEYYGSWDPVLHDEHVTHIMFRRQPNDIEVHGSAHIPTWNEDVRKAVVARQARANARSPQTRQMRICW